MHSFPDRFRALVIGASGAIGGAFVRQLQSDPRCGAVLGIHRHSQPPIDFEREDSIAAAAGVLEPDAPFHLIVVATGVLHATGFMPEKKLADLAYGPMSDVLRINLLGPAICVRHFSRLLDAQRGVMVLLSAKVGSIEDNRLGGWYSYRASKAALNMVVKTAAIEVRRGNPNAVLVSMHPGTVSSRLSQPFRGAEIGRGAAEATADMLAVIDRLTPSDSGRFCSYNGQWLPW